MNELQPFVFPFFSEDKTRDLYLRGTGTLSENSISLLPGEQFKTNTLFNVFDGAKWKEYTNVEEISIEVEFSGSIKVKLFKQTTAHEKAFKLGDISLTGEGEETSRKLAFEGVKLDSSKYFISIEAEKHSIFYGYKIQTLSDFVQKNIHLALVFCTFKREDYVLNNISSIEKFIKNTPALKESLYLYVVDNGNTLEESSTDYYKIMHNRNTGGAGGFTRGIIEAHNRKERFSHVILMDDDIVLDPMIFLRAYYFLLHSKQEVVLGASMIVNDFEKSTLFARGFINNYNFTPTDKAIGNGGDLRDFKTIYSESKEITGQGWWWYCFPLKVVDRYGFPFPFFTKMDDVEFPTRLTMNNVPLTVMDGFAVWHESFHSKYSPLPLYFRYRNRWIFKAIRDREDSLQYFIKASLSYLYQNLSLYRYEHVAIFLLAINDFLKGREIIGKFTEERFKVLKEIIKVEKSSHVGLIRNSRLIGKESKKRKLFRLLTLNYFLTPAKGEIVVPNNTQNVLTTCISKRKITFQISSKDQLGFTVHKSKRKSIYYLMKIFFTFCNIIFKYHRAIRSYKDSKDSFITKEYWIDYLSIEKS